MYFWIWTEDGGLSEYFWIFGGVSECLRGGVGLVFQPEIRVYNINGIFL